MSDRAKPEADVEDLQILARDRALAHLPRRDIERLLAHLSQRVLLPGTVLVREGESGDDMYFILEGSARVSRGKLTLKSLGPAEHFGELALSGQRKRAATVEAQTVLRAGRLSRADYQALSRESPATVVRLLEALLDGVGSQLVQMTDSVQNLLDDRLLPRRATVRVAVADQVHEVPTGTRVGTLLPERDGDYAVVGALVDGRPAALASSLVADATLLPLTTANWEGRDVCRRSAGLLLIECAAQLTPKVALRMGAALERAQHVEVSGGGRDLAELCDALNLALSHQIEQRALFREELWTIEEAIAELAARGEEDAVALLTTSREQSVRLASCGSEYALSAGPFLPHAGFLLGTRLVAGASGLMLVYGDEVERPLLTRGNGAHELELEAQRPRFGGEMVREQRRWRNMLDATSVGAFNQTCISGRVAEVIRVAEGFHEKRIGSLADEIAARRQQLRIICVAGPSSSGKTTLIKRLTTQLEINGIRPHALSLDDYYLDRALTPRDAQGDYDYEALEALDLAALASDVKALLGGQAVRPPRYDFKTGMSLKGQGAELALGANDVLLVEGIHGGNPALLGDAAAAEQLFRVFIHPASTLPIDRLDPVSPHDLRLIRRIVRDRFHRSTNAADSIMRWPSVRRGEALHIYPFLGAAHAVFDSALLYEPSVLKVYADRYLLEVPSKHPARTTAHRLRLLLDRYVTIYPDHVPPTSILREFIGGSGFDY